MDSEEMKRLHEKFEQHVVRFEQHEQEEAEKFIKLVEAQQNNTDAIAKLTDSVSSLVDDTKVIIQLSKDFQGAARVGKGVQNFMLWILKWGMIGTGVVAMIHFVVNHFTHH